MRILWVCNIVMPEFCEEFGIKRTCYGGWMSGMLKALSSVSEIEIACCFPIIDESRMKKGEHDGHRYYSFHASMDKKYSETFVHEFVEIYRDFCPDIIYIWGTEYPHARVAVSAAIVEGLINRVIVHIQGYVGYYALYYANGIPGDIVTKIDDKGNSIEQDMIDFAERGKNERWIIQHVRHVCGRTDWDRFCTEEMNTDIIYHSCGEILREVFYQFAGMWSLEKMKRNRIFLSQASYPVKGFHLFLRALPTLVERFPDIEIHIGGVDIINLEKSMSPYGMYIKDIIHQYNLEDVVKFLGKLTEKEMLMEYLQANVFVSPSVIENSSNSIGEAMLLGCPVIASDVGGTSGLIAHKADGLLYPYDEICMLVGYIKRIFEDDVFARCISKNAQVTAKKRYDTLSITNRIYDIFKQVIEEQGHKCNGKI